MNELEQYTDDELRKELKRRAKIRRANRAKEIKKDPYIYTTGVVESLEFNFHGKGFRKYSVKIAHSVDVNRYWDRIFPIAYGCGFNLKNLPCSGDTVMLRKRNHVNEKLNIFSQWNVCKIIKRKKEN